LEIDKDMSWKTHIDALPKFTRVCYVVRCFKHYGTIQTLEMVYHTNFHSAMVYGIIFWGNSIDSNKVFLQQKRIMRDNIGN